MDKLHGYPRTSVGGKAILRGRDAFERGEPCPGGWPYLAERGWYDRKAESLAIKKGTWVVRENLMNLMIWRGYAESEADALSKAPPRNQFRRAYRVLYKPYDK